jgi:hypothetical protein
MFLHLYLHLSFLHRLPKNNTKSLSPSHHFVAAVPGGVTKLMLPSAVPNLSGPFLAHPRTSRLKINLHLLSIQCGHHGLIPAQNAQPSSQAAHLGRCGYLLHGARWNEQFGLCGGTTDSFLPFGGTRYMFSPQPQSSLGSSAFFLAFGASSFFGGMRGDTRSV